MDEDHLEVHHRLDNIQMLVHALLRSYHRNHANNMLEKMLLVVMESPLLLVMKIMRICLIAFIGNLQTHLITI